MSNYLDYLCRRIGYESYSTYLKSEHWKNFSDGMRFKRCFCCDKSNNNHQIHHVSYDRLGEELPNDVITVCGACHILIHDKIKQGYHLNKAHHLVKKQFKKKKRWVSNWRKLLNKSKQQTLTELQHFLESNGLLESSDENPPMFTDKAKKLKLVVKRNGSFVWDIRKYKKVVHSINKAKGKFQDRNS